MQDRDHLRRLRHVWLRNPTYFLTTCTAQRRKILARPQCVSIMVNAWRVSPALYGWVVGRYVIMPGHIHFFVSPRPEAKRLSTFVGDWKKWTGRKIASCEHIDPPVWQPEYFDHLLRSVRSYSEKWDYVWNNPVRGGLCASAEDWPYAGECEALGF
jgi:putative transposase